MADPGPGGADGDRLYFRQLLSAGTSPRPTRWPARW